MNKIFDSRINSRYLAFLLKQNRKLIVVLSLVFLYLIPLNFYTSNRYMLVSEVASYSYSLEFPFQSAIVILIILSIVIPCILLSFIMNRSKMDTYQTLPIRKRDFFLNHFIEALLVLLIPFVFAWLLGIGVGYIMFPTWFEVGDVFTHLLKVILYTPFFVGLTQFAFINSGRMFDGLLYAGILHITQFFMFGIITTLFNDRLLGLSTYLDSNIASFLSPDISLFNWIGGNFNFMVIVWVVLGIVLHFVNQHLYLNRKIENIDDSAVNPWFVPLVTMIIFGLFISFIYLIFLPYTGFFNSIILPFVFGLISYLIMDGIINRGFHNLYKAIRQYAIISVIAGVVIYGSIFTGFFGLTKQTPELNSFDKVLLVSEHSMLSTEGEFNVSRQDAVGLVNGASRMEDILNVPYLGDFRTYVFESDYDKERILTTHRYIIDHFYSEINPLNYNGYGPVHQSTLNNNVYYYDGSEFYFVYIKDGAIIQRRSYQMFSSYLSNLLRPKD
ncbi:MAG TPA: hypothetical protein GX703_02650 [Erysipelothrix sp.]|nr:hypothetical protein [Erysipelothrix sp.]